MASVAMSSGTGAKTVAFKRPHWYVNTFRDRLKAGKKLSFVHKIRPADPTSVLAFTELPGPDARLVLKKTVSGWVVQRGSKYILGAFGFSPTYRGDGYSFPQARQDFVDKIKHDFAYLYSLRPFQMTPKERTRWRLLNSMIDVRRYSETRPLEVREIGRVASLHAGIGPDDSTAEIEWLDGGRESVLFAQTTGTFRKLSEGDWFDCKSHRRPRDGRLIAFKEVYPTAAVHRLSADEALARKESVPPADPRPVDHDEEPLSPRHE